ncbi:MAG TPA: efflux RND transporter periplasmic adaptor subunit [Blastocatellia bacterium]|nr:efflux RND transporter periplasmic adaptor subunit [Blastocatellia bacterium]HYW70669.1 efflux RND transporter periplasmic adaptor subunit [Pyrinomonadaceae bacterium]
MDDTPATRRRNAILIIAVIALIVFGLTVLIVWRLKKSKGEEEAKVTPVVSVKVATAEKGEIAAQVVAVGTIWPREKADVGAKVSAQIRKMALLKNKVVRAGEVIAVLESKDLQAERAEAVAALNQARAEERSLETGQIPKTNAEDQKALNDARAKVNNARALYERRQRLFEQGGISQKDLEASQLDLTTAEDELRLEQQTVALRGRSLNPNDRALAAAKTAQAQQHVATLDAQLSYATIRAPITGIVTDQYQYEGEFAAAGGKLITIADTSTVIVKAPFSDTAAAQLKPGDAAAVVPTDTSAEEMKGQITLLSRSSDPTNRTVEVWVTLANGAGKLRANGAAQVTVMANSKTEAIIVPASAVTLEASNADEGTVMIVDAKNVARERKVTVGIRSGDKMEITEGLEEGDTVVVEGNFALPDGTKVEIAKDEGKEGDKDEDKKDDKDKD